MSFYGLRWTFRVRVQELKEKKKKSNINIYKSEKGVTRVYRKYTGIKNQLQKLHKTNKSTIKKKEKERIVKADSQYGFRNPSLAYLTYTTLMK